MATVGSTVLTLSDLKARLDPQGGLDTIIELLLQDNEGLLQDIPWMEGNLPTGHKTTVRTGEPSVTARLINQGVPRGKSATAQITDTTAMFEGYSVPDKALVDLSGNPARARFSEDAAFISAFKNKISSSVFYANENLTPAEFTGLTPRYNLRSAQNADNIIDGGGTGTDNASIWLVNWGDASAFGIYPKGSQGGMQIRDLGEDTVLDGNGNEYQAYRTHFKWDAGLTLRDWRQAVRVCNIDVSLLTADMSTGADLVDLMTQASERINEKGPNTVWYVPRRLREIMRRQILNKTNVRFGTGEVAGKTVTTFDEMPLRRVDALILNEARVV